MDTGAGVMLPEAADFSSPPPSRPNLPTLIISPLFAALNGLSETSELIVRSFSSSTNELVLKRVALLPVESSSLDPKLADFRPSLLSHAHLVQQGGFIFIPKHAHGGYVTPTESHALFVLAAEPYEQVRPPFLKLSFPGTLNRMISFSLILYLFSFLFFFSRFIDPCNPLTHSYRASSTTRLRPCSSMRLNERRCDLSR